MPKLQGNQERFEEQALLLRQAGWRVMVIWQCELARSPQQVMARIRSALCAREILIK